MTIGIWRAGILAWFQATVSAANVLEAATNSGTLTVEKTTANVGYDATIHFEVESAASKLIELTTWDGNDLKKGTVPVGGVTTDVNLVDATIADETYVLAVNAWITDDSTNDGTGHADRFFAGLQSASTETRKVTYTYTNTDDTGALLTNEEVYFYCATTNGGYGKGSEGVSGESGKRQQLSVSVNDLLYDSDDDEENDTYHDASNKLIIGYLFVRFEGSKRIHNENTTYTATIIATAGRGAAANNA